MKNNMESYEQVTIANCERLYMEGLCAVCENGELTGFEYEEGGMAQN